MKSGYKLEETDSTVTCCFLSISELCQILYVSNDKHGTDECFHVSTYRVVQCLG